MRVSVLTGNRNNPPSTLGSLSPFRQTPSPGESRASGPTALVRHTSYEQIDLLPATGHFARYDLSQQEQWESAPLHTALADARVSNHRKLR
ncbi:MAG: hypothetical protein ACYTG0_08585 [Planctomycetota bacterium]|jgi:hypothetical protein